MLDTRFVSIPRIDIILSFPCIVQSPGFVKTTAVFFSYPIVFKSTEDCTARDTVSGSENTSITPPIK